jgi:hypothetical protein
MTVGSVNLARVRAALRYENVHEVAGNGLLRFVALPSNREWPSVYMVLQPDPESGKHHVLQAGFGEWHEHFDEYPDPDRNVADALAWLAKIVSGQVCLVAGHDDRGRYVRGALRPVSAAGPSIVHGVLGAGKAVKFTRYVFNRAPESIGDP